MQNKIPVPSFADGLLEYAEYPMVQLANVYSVPVDLIRWRYEQMKI